MKLKVLADFLAMIFNVCSVVDPINVEASDGYEVGHRSQFGERELSVNIKLTSEYAVDKMRLKVHNS